MKFFASISAVIVTFALTESANVTTQGRPWGYRQNPNMVHPSQWADKWKSCGSDRQSPIDIVTTPRSTKGQKLPLVFSGNCPQFNLWNPQEPLEADVVGGNCAVSLNGAAYNMAQFHLHAPSEHTLNGKQMDGEVHFVHLTEDRSAILVVGVFLRICSKSDEWLGPVLDALEQVGSTERSNALLVNLRSYSSLVQKAYKTGGIYNYAGSLTTPPCDATVDWWVVQDPIQISAADFDRLHQDLIKYSITDNGNNARPTQRLNGRVVVRYN
ncbi:unnamed protein product [Peronospora belbahrii]|uniref:carbonic anhydrase n=1 Tax=Peronospora belbahrii TaxID=622444 RepID=A0AAU9LA93_9STRA|nr:unnamed protein product [Peronospora belbahrii]CAH0513615.1 unnamed protein product [Peronospora belbahrii]